MTTITSDYDTRSVFDGIYDVPEAARYLKASAHGNVAYPVTSAKLIRWIRKGMASPELPGQTGRDLLIAFEDLVSLRIIIALRGAGVGWAEIRRGKPKSGFVKRRELGGRSPRSICGRDRGIYFVDWTQRLISASRNGQLAFDVLRTYLIPIHGLAFSEQTHLASSWEPSDCVLLQPQIQFGAPCIKGTRIPTRTIFGMIEADFGVYDSVEWVARAYRISKDEAQAAYDWENRIHAT